MEENNTIQTWILFEVERSICLCLSCLFTLLERQKWKRINDGWLEGYQDNDGGEKCKHCGIFSYCQSDTLEYPLGSKTNKQNEW